MSTTTRSRRSPLADAPGHGPTTGIEPRPGREPSPDPEPVPAVAPGGELRMIPIGLLVPSPDNPRGDLGDLAELSASIAGVGLVEPLLVRPQKPFGDGWWVVAGHRRLAAARLAGLEALPCIERALTDEAALELMLVENLQREGISPLEEARAYRRLLDQGSSQRKLASRTGRSQGTISKRLALLNLPGELQARIGADSRGITLREAEVLSQLNGRPKLQAEAATSWNIEEAVRATNDRIQREARAAAELGALAAEGMATVPWSRDDGDWKVLGDEHAGYGRNKERLRVSAARHRKEPCAAVTVDPANLARVNVCTDPARHGPKGASKLKESSVSPRQAVDPKQAEEQRQAKAAEKLREGCMQRLLARGASAGLQDHALKVLIANARADQVKLACDLLVQAPVDDGNGYKDYRAGLEVWLAGEGASGLRAAGLAIALAAGELATRSPWAQEPTVVAAHLVFLGTVGYELADWDRRKLAAVGGSVLETAAQQNSPSRLRQGGDAEGAGDGDGEAGA